MTSRAQLSAAVVLLALASAPVAPAAAANVLYADPGGLGVSCTQVSPCDIVTAVAKANNGDTVYLNQGTYAPSTTVEDHNAATITVTPGQARQGHGAQPRSGDGRGQRSPDPTAGAQARAPRRLTGDGGRCRAPARPVHRWPAGRRRATSRAAVCGRDRRQTAVLPVLPVELGGLEPPTSWVRSRRSPS